MTNVAVGTELNTQKTMGLGTLKTELNTQEKFSGPYNYCFSRQILIKFLYFYEASKVFVITLRFPVITRGPQRSILMYAKFIPQ